jgi:hypothetical protein
MVSTIPLARVEAPTPVPFRYGLQSVVIPRTDERALLAGIEQESAGCDYLYPNVYREPWCDEDVPPAEYGLSVYVRPDASGPTAVEVGIYPQQRRWMRVTVDGTLFFTRGGSGEIEWTGIVVLAGADVEVTATDPSTGATNTETLTVSDPRSETQASLGSVNITGVREVKHGPQDFTLTEARPFTIYSTSSCAGLSYEDAKRRALAAFESREQAWVEWIFWEDILAAGSPEQPYVSPVGVVQAVAELEDTMSLKWSEQVVIHAPRVVYPYAAAAGLIERDKNQLRTPAGSLWSFGVGYDRWTAHDDVDWGSIDTGAGMYATGPVYQWRGDTIVLPDNAGQALDRISNEMEMVVERQYMLGFDACTYAATVVDLAAPAGGGGGF